LNLLFVDAILVGHAQLMNIETELPMSASDINWAISLFYLAYVRNDVTGL
jgi:hypothetical protein